MEDIRLSFCFLFLFLLSTTNFGNFDKSSHFHLIELNKAKVPSEELELPVTLLQELPNTGTAQENLDLT